MVGRQAVGRVLLLVGMAVWTFGCPSDGGRGGGGSPTDPGVASISLTASPTSIAIAGVSQLVATATGPTGAPLAGEDIQFESTLGILGRETVVTDAGGRANTALFGTQTGTATVAARLPGTAVRGEAEVTIGQGNRIILLTAPSTVDTGGEAHILVRVQPRDGSNPPRDLNIELIATLGSISSPNLRTDNLGAAQTTFLAGESAGTAEITATLPSTGEAESTTIMISSAVRSLSLEVAPIVIDPAGRATLTVTVLESSGLPASSVTVDLETSLGRIADPRLVTSGAGLASTILDPLGVVGTAFIEASIEDELMATRTVDVVEAIVTVRANPQQIASTDGVSTILVSALRADGQPIARDSRFRLSSTLGELAVTTISANDAGVAQTTLRAAGQRGVAEVRATLLGTDASSSVFVVLGE